MTQIMVLLTLFMSIEYAVLADSITTPVPIIKKQSYYQPTVNTSWHWQLQGKINTNIKTDVYIIDLFDSSFRLIRQLKKKNIHVICYFSAGSYENWRRDKYQFDKIAIGKEMDGWAGERWTDIRHASVRKVIKKRLDLAHKKGCDGIEPDNIDGYTNKTGFPLTAEDQLNFNRFIAQESHQRQLAVALKNDLNQIIELVDVFDFAINEQCHQFDECHLLQPFIDQGKPVFNAEYNKKYIKNKQQRKVLCQDANKRQFKTLILPRALDNRFRISC
ncbi:MAG: endo alpha-1,4 polygalactosaminidase [Methylococcales bacterium]|nr:endo alpha-1,4 polygalactosaminidase [Methylococcales bacterium]